MEVTTALLQTANEDDTLYYKQHAVCGFWDEDDREWATLGCERSDITDYLSPIYCRCAHTTTFGIFLPAEKYSNFDYKLLAERIGIYFICLISIISLVYVMRAIHLIWGLFKGPLTIFIHSNLLVGSLLLTLVFIVSSETMDFDILCTTFGVLVHFFYMSLLTWLIVECIYLYMLKTKIRIEGSSISKKPGYFICGWGGAASIAALFFGIHYGYSGQSGCWLRFETGSLVAFIFPAMALILIRIVLIVFMLTKEIKGKKRQEYITAQIRRCIGCSCFLTPLFILTWVFALMVDEQYIFWLMFYILFSLNGVFVALYCYCSFEMSEIRRHDRSLSSQSLTRSSTSVDKMDDPIVLALDTESCVQVAGEQPGSKTDLVMDINSCVEAGEVQSNAEEENQNESDESEVSSDTESEPSSDDGSETSDEGSQHSAESDKEGSNDKEKEDSDNEKSEKEESDAYDSDDACFGK
ncbi:adhesion G protein-coupled receptor L4-like [Anneissia japonica]|uniref:adhesion G protein-coupled receptor L4-like n=1 Tax=Anneissia japonica TaxID=1529436 RepID=UPI001425AB21|nr:adhesion G protein-coupled receptor L4-like [Anneissia japonica]